MIVRAFVRVVPTAAVIAAAVAWPHAAGQSDPFAFLSPDLVVTEGERLSLDSGQTVVKVLPGRDGYLALSAIVKIEAPTERVVTWMTDVERLQRGKYVPEVGRFSTPPQLDDLRGLTFDPEDLAELRRCRPGSCGVKLDAREMTILRAIQEPAALDTAFRQVLVSRATEYSARGDDCVLPYQDHKTVVRPADAFRSLLDRLRFFERHFARHASYLRTYPEGSTADVRHSFLYWSKETLGMKPIIAITHLSVMRPGSPGLPEAVIVSKQIYATHYKNASISMTAVAADGASRYLVYVNRSHIDAFRGLLGGFVRRVVERRVLAEAPDVLNSLRRRVESPVPVSTRN